MYAKSKTLFCITQMILWPLAGMTQVPGENSTTQQSNSQQIFYVNPVHALNGNITISYEKFTSAQKSFKIILSGGQQADYVAIGGDLNYYPSAPSDVNYFIGVSLLAYESPIKTGVPVSQPWNRFFESKDDRYFLSVQLKNGGLFRLRRFLYFEIDAAIGPAYNISDGEWLAVWSINLSLGIPFGHNKR